MGLLSGLFGKKQGKHVQTMASSSPEEQQKAALMSLVMAMAQMSDDGVDADELPNGYGAFGLTATNPVPTRTVIGSHSYLGRLRAPDGSKVVTKRLWSVSSEVSPHPIDEYEVTSAAGVRLPNVFLSMYHRRTSGRAPNGFTLTAES